MSQRGETQTLTRLRRESSKLLEELQQHPYPMLITRRQREIAVLLTPQQYHSLHAQQGNNHGFILDQVQMLCQRLAAGGPDHPLPGLLSYSHASFDRYQLIYRRHHSNIVIYTLQNPPHNKTASKHRKADCYPQL